ncbi:hypothetical protein H2200_010641 [Cladophialophora chaetospira]|uniref:Uncharacterized protein n=1 Tax=Cladophialophora chaetospira TaxID=386627 RepID=A0AA38X0J7_9EURO|nr:hypothetical protein H2200_010641 [Cladophialophora chaetospira]
MTSTPGSDLEKGGTGTPHVHEHHHLPFHHGHNHARRFLEFVHPHTGKTLIICQTPEHLERRRTELLQERSQDEFDVLLQGSAEHLEAIRELHAHHEAQRDRLRDQNGDLYANIEHVKGELDALAAEIHHVTAHAVSLDASFDRYGYSAHLRTTDEDSERSSLHSDHPSAQEKHKDRSVEAVQFFKRPAVRQYFHKGLLWRSSRAGEVGSFELFVDLVYVGVIDIVGERAAEHPDGLSLLQFTIIFCIAWKIWADLTMWINYFEMDDIFQRSKPFEFRSCPARIRVVVYPGQRFVCVIFYLVCLFGFTTNTFYAFESTYTSCIAFYVTQRLFGATWFAAVAVILKQVRGAMLTTAIITVVTAAIWIASIHVPWPGQLAPIVIAIFLDLFGNVILIGMMKAAAKKRLPDVISRSFEFFPAINIEHRVERNNAFVSLVFGYSILTILFQSRSSFGINAFFGKGVLGLVQAFMFNW